MKTVITILTTAMAMTALAVPYQNVARDSHSAETDTILVPTPTTKLFPPDTTLVPTPTGKLLPPAESAEKVHVQIHSTNKVLVTVTPTPSASSSSTPAPSSKSAEDTDGKKVGLV
ncbi:hypothetical protein CDV55_107593 [Aspergillus turcosus]|nr:hypothetical protein CDV55_107593 [Aspergillus turcosus]